MRRRCGQRKGAGGHGIGFRSITAAAEKPVTFGRCFSWLEARLLGWWGSSSAQGTAYPGVSLGARRGGTLGRPYSGQRTASKSAPSSAPFGGTFPLKGGRLDGKGPLIRLAFGQTPFPKLGGRVRTPAPTRVQGRSQTGPRAHTVRPYGGKRTRDVGSEAAGAVVEPYQLQFPSRSGPQWGRTEPRSSTPDFARRKGCATSRRALP